MGGIPLIRNGAILVTLGLVVQGPTGLRPLFDILGAEEFLWGVTLVHSVAPPPPLWAIWPTDRPPIGRPLARPPVRPPVRPVARPTDRPTSCPTDRPTDCPTACPITRPTDRPTSRPTSPPSPPSPRALAGADSAGGGADGCGELIGLRLPRPLVPLHGVHRRSAAGPDGGRTDARGRTI